MSEPIAAEAQVAAAVERAEKAERQLEEARADYDEAVNTCENEGDLLVAAVERERELTRLLAAARGFVDWIASWAGGDLNGLTWNYVIAEAIRTREALAGGVSAAGRPPEPRSLQEVVPAAPEVLPEETP